MGKERKRKGRAFSPIVVGRQLENSKKKKKKNYHVKPSRAGYPFATLVDFASDGAGFPIFNLSPLAMHTRNLLEDPRACLVVEMPGWSGLANARVTIFGEVGPLPEELQEAGRELFAAKQAASEELLAPSSSSSAGGSGNGGGAMTSNGGGVVSGGGVSGGGSARKSSSPGSPQQQKQRGFVSGNATLFRMHRISDIYFVGGFGTVSWVDPAEYARARPDAVASLCPRATLSALNEAHSSAAARLLFSAPDGSPADDAAFISVDARGADVRLRRGAQYGIERLAFSRRVESQEEALRETAALLAEAEANGTPSSSSAAVGSSSPSSSSSDAPNGAAAAHHAGDPVGKA